MSRNRKKKPPPADPNSADTLRMAPPTIVMGSNSTGRAPTVRRPPAPLGIRHLLLWIACTGGYLALNPRWTSRYLPPLRMLLLITRVVPCGAAVAGLLLFVERRVRRVAGPIEPGEWLVAIVGGWLLLETLLLGHLSQRLHNPHQLLMALTCLLLVLPTFDRRLAYRWRILFAALVALNAYPLVLDVMGQGPIFSRAFPDWLAKLSQPAQILLAVGGMLTVVGLDYRAGARHGWLHWFGLMVVIVIELEDVLFPLVAGAI